MTALLASLALVVAQTSVTFQWAPPAGAPPTFYEVEISKADAPDEIFITTQPSITLSFAVGRDVSIRVSACEGPICGAWSDPSQVFSLNLSADLSGDSVVGLPDYSLLITQIGQVSDDDLTGDGIIGLVDVNVWREKFGQCIGPISLDGNTVQAYLPCDLVFP